MSKPKRISRLGSLASSNSHQCPIYKYIYVYIYMCTCIYVYNAFNALEVHEESGRVGRRGGEQGGGGRKYMGHPGNILSLEM